MHHASATVELAILRVPAGSPFIASEFRTYGDATTVRSVLDRMRALGLVVRVDAGVYMRPLRDERGAPIPPSVAALLEAVRRADHCAVQPADVQGGTAFTFWTGGKPRTIRLGATTVRLLQAPVAALPE